MLLLTADRPPELRGIGANQATRQPGLYAGFTRWEADLPVPTETDQTGMGDQTVMLRRTAAEALAAARGENGRPAGPVHLNLPYRDPLAGSLPGWLTAPVGTPAVDVAPPEPSGALYQGGGGIGGSEGANEAGTAEVDPDAVLERGPRTVVIAGADAGAGAEALAHEGGWPLIAEIVSGARFGRHLVHGYRTLLGDPALGGRVERAVVFGHPTLSREVAALLSRDDVSVLAVRGPGEPLNLNGATAQVDAVSVAPGAGDREWLGAWMRASHAASFDLNPPAPDPDALSSAVPDERLPAIAAELAVLRAPVDRAALVDAAWRATWPHDRLMFGSSRLVRVADTVLGGKKVPVHANRGLAGIDGTIATAMGIALASQDVRGQDASGQDASGRDAAARRAAGVTRVLLGDLAMLHDVGALLVPPAEVAPRMQIIVGNDGGGTIFDGLEVARIAGEEAMDRVLYTPHEVRLEEIAGAYGWEYRRATTRSELDQALTSAGAARLVIEVPLSR